jgi:very-short-patch-repair endonuclease
MPDYLKQLAQYYLEVLKNVRATSNAFLINVTQGRSHEYVDLSFILDGELLLTDRGDVTIAPIRRTVSRDETSAANEIRKMSLKEGNRVRHNDFGDGTVTLVELDPEGRNSRVTVMFDNQEIGQKLLAIGRTPLVKLGDAEDLEVIDRETTFQRLLALHQKHVLNPYEREFLYAYPFLVGKAQNGRKICAPLFTVPCHLEYDLSSGRLRLRLTSAELQFNSYVWAEVIGEQQLHYLEMTVLAQGYPLLPLKEKEFSDFLNRLGNAVSALEPPPSWEWTLERLAKPDTANVTEQELKIMPHAALLLVSRPQYYLRRDLEELQSSPGDIIEQSVLSTVFSGELQTPSDRLSEEDSQPLPEDYLFPFESNPSQRSVAQAIEQNRLIVVQGPPGTGKSQTICNLVCHLVASGKTVLVTSQKNKALEVVGEKLAKLAVEYLSMTLLKDDTESKRELAQRLDTLDAHLQEISLTSLKRDVGRMNEKRHQIKQMSKELRRRFQSARERESEQGQLYQQYYETREDDIFPEDITLPEIESDSLADHLFDYAKSYIEGGVGFLRSSWWRVLSSWVENLPEIISLPEKVAETITEIVGKWREIVLLISQYEIVELKNRLVMDVAFPTKRATDLTTELEKARDIAIECARQEELTRRGYTNGNEIVEIACRIGVLPDNTRQKLYEDVNALASCAHAMYENLSAKWFQLAKLYRRYHALSTSAMILKRLPSELRPQHLQEVIHSGDIIAWEEEKDKLHTILELAKLENQLKTALDAQIYPVIIREGLKQKSVSEVERLFDVAISALRVIILAGEIRAALPRLSVIDTTYKLQDLLNKDDVKAIDEVTKTLERLASSFPHFSRIKKLEELLGQKLVEWLRDYCDKEPVAMDEEFRWRFHRAIEAYCLRVNVEQDLRESPEDTAKLASKLQEQRNHLTDTIRKLLSIRINHRLKEACNSRALGREIATLRQALRRGKKNFQSFERLKKEINFEAILKVFPCWVMSIDDVCRVFPLNPGLFDVLIVDEASQCHLMGALPLLYRAKAAVIVGDEKQLPNADVMFLDQSVNNELKRRFAIDALPKGFAFDARESSLLDLIELWRERKIFLNEHFRSLPEIIRFCNERFYAGRLRIMTHSTHVPPDGVFEIEPVPDALEDDNKINRREAEELVDELISCLEDRRYDGLSFGVLSLFREQAAYIEKLLQRRLLEHPELMNRQASEPLIASTVDGFQGDERDVIFYSFRFAPNSHPGVIQAIQQGKLGECRINVAFSRARKKVVCFASRDIEEFPAGLVRDFLVYAKNPSAGTTPRSEPFDSPLEQDVCRRFEAQGLQVDPQYPACGFFIDLVVTDEEGRRLAVECDGQFHYDETGELRIEDLDRQEILERAGWHVVRIPSRRYWRDPNQCIDEVIAVLKSLPPVFVQEAVPGARPAASKEAPFVPEEEDTEVEEEIFTEPEPQEKHREALQPDAQQRARAREVSPATEELPKESSVWFALARWAKENNHLTPRERQFSYKVGIYLNNGWKLSDKMQAWALKILHEAMGLGFRQTEMTQRTLF